MAKKAKNSKKKTKIPKKSTKSSRQTTKISKDAKKRRYSQGAEKEVGKELRRYKKGTAKSGRSGKGGKVKSRRQSHRHRPFKSTQRRPESLKRISDYYKAHQPVSPGTGAVLRGPRVQFADCCRRVGD